MLAKLLVLLKLVKITVVVIIENYGLQPVVLGKGDEIGQLELVELVPDEAKAKATGVIRNESRKSWINWTVKRL